MSEVSQKVAQLAYTKMANSILFPRDDRLFSVPWAKRAKPHMKDAALLANNVNSISETTHLFEIGNDNAEMKAPHYHILEDAQTIHYGNRRARRVVKNPDGTKSVRAYGKVRSWGTTKSRGSQANAGASRDYGKWSYSDDGKLRQEYRSGGKKKAPTETSTAYDNVHFHYIERIMEVIIPEIASEIGGTVGRGTFDFFEETEEADNSLLLPMIGKATI